MNDEKEELQNKHLREMRKEIREGFRQIDKRLQSLEEDVENGYMTQQEKEEIAIKGPGGGPANKEIAKIIKRSKVGRGIETPEVEQIIGKSRKTALRKMREIAREFDWMGYRKRGGNKADLLVHKGGS
jgi:hypothetical protein